MSRALNFAMRKDGSWEVLGAKTPRIGLCEAQEGLDGENMWKLGVFMVFNSCTWNPLIFPAWEFRASASSSAPIGLCSFSGFTFCSDENWPTETEYVVWWCLIQPTENELNPILNVSVIYMSSVRLSSKETWNDPFCIPSLPWGAKRHAIGAPGDDTVPSSGPRAIENHHFGWLVFFQDANDPCIMASYSFQWFFLGNWFGIFGILGLPSCPPYWSETNSKPTPLWSKWGHTSPNHIWRSTAKHFHLTSGPCFFWD